MENYNIFLKIIIFDKYCLTRLTIRESYVKLISCFFAQIRFIYAQKSDSVKIGFKLWEVKNSGFLMF